MPISFDHCSEVMVTNSVLEGSGKGEPAIMKPVSLDGFSIATVASCSPRSSATDASIDAREGAGIIAFSCRGGWRVGCRFLYWSFRFCCGSRLRRIPSLQGEGEGGDGGAGSE